MARKLFHVGNGLADDNIYYLSGSGAPGGDASYEDEAGVGSYYKDIVTGEQYTKDTAGAGAGNWSQGAGAAALTALQGEVDDFETAVGVDTDGTLIPYSGTNYIDAAGSLVAADVALDTAVGNLQSEVDGIEAAAGAMIDANGDYVAHTSTNYLDANADITEDLLDLDAALFAADADALSRTGDTMDSGADLVFVGGGEVTGLPGVPSGATAATSKAYVDGLVSSGASWRNPLVDSDLVDVVGANPATPEATYGLSPGDNISFIATAAITFSLGTGATVVGTQAGDIVNLVITSAGNGDYTLIETPLSAGDRFIISAEHGTIGTGLSTLTMPDTFNLANGDLIEFTGLGAGDGSTAGDWDTPEGRSGQAGGGTEIDQGVTVLNADPDSIHYGHTYLYDQTADGWYEIAGPGSIEAGIGLAYSGNILNVNLGAGISELPSDEVGIDLRPNSGLITTLDGSTSDTTTGAQLAILLDGATLEMGASGLKVGTSVLNEIDGIEATIGAAIDAAGDYVAHTTSNYIDGNLDLTEDLLDLDAQVKVNADAISALGGTTLVDLQNEVDAIEAAMGTVIDVNGDYVAFVGTTYLDGNVSVFEDLTDLDTAIDGVATASGNVQSELDTTQANAGLDTDGTYIANVGTNYIDGATSLAGADVLLDQAVADRAAEIGNILNYSSNNVVVDTEDLATSIGKLDAALGNTLAPSEALGISTQTVLDQVLVDDIELVKWLVTAVETASGDKEAFEVLALHDGTAAADATAADYNIYGKLRFGNITGYDIDVVVSGVGAAQEMRLLVESTGAVDVHAVRLSV